MAENRKRLTDRSQTRQPRHRRQLRFEPLESRSLLSAIGMTAPGEGAIAPPVESLPPPTTAVIPTELIGSAHGLAQTKAIRHQVLSRSLADQIMAISAARPEGLLPAANAFVNTVVFSTVFAQESGGQSMAVVSLVIPRSSFTALSGLDAFHDAVLFGGSLVRLTPLGGSSGSVGSIGGTWMVLPESRLSMEVVSGNAEFMPDWRGGESDGRSMVVTPQTSPGRSTGFSPGGDVLHNLTPLASFRAEPFAVGGGGPVRWAPGQLDVIPAASSTSGSSSLAWPSSGSAPWYGSSAHSPGGLPTSSYDVTEGGYVEIGEMPLTSGRSNSARETSESDLDGGDLGDSTTRADQLEDVSYQIALLAENQGRSSQWRSDDAVRRNAAEQSLVQLANAADGGMIELAAAAPQDGQPDSTNRASNNGDPLPNAKEIELDKGLGLFHAFELATVSNQRADDAGDASAKTGEPGLPPETDPSATPADASAKTSTASEDSEADGQLIFRRAALSTVVLATMLVPLGIRRERQTSEQRQIG
jgi:hypothetical protein